MEKMEGGDGGESAFCRSHAISPSDILNLLIKASCWEVLGELSPRLVSHANSNSNKAAKNNQISSIGIISPNLAPATVGDIE